MYVFATPMCVWRRHAGRHRRCKGVKVVGRRASPRRRKNYGYLMNSNAAVITLLDRIICESVCAMFLHGNTESAR